MAALEMVSDRGAFTPVAAVGRQGRGVLHTPPLTGRKTRRNVSAFAPVGAPGGRMLLRPTWVHIHDMGASAPAALEMVSDGGAFVPAAFCLLLVFGDQQQLVALVKPEGTVGDEELVVALDEHD